MVTGVVVAGVVRVVVDGSATVIVVVTVLVVVIVIGGTVVDAGDGDITTVEIVVSGGNV